MRIVHFEVESSLCERVALHALATGEPIWLHRATDGLALMREVAAFKPDVIVANYWLSAAEGWSVVERMRRIAPGVPVILASEHLPDDVIADSLDAGAADCLPLERLGRLGMSLLRSVRVPSPALALAA